MTSFLGIRGRGQGGEAGRSAAGAACARAIFRLLLAALPLAGGGGCSDSNGSARDPAPPLRAARQSLYVPARDGTRIAVEVSLPAGLAQGAQSGTVLRVTRYWRAFELSSGGVMPDPFVDAVAAHGNAYVAMDVRGSGASFGVSTAPWSPEEVLDYRDIVDWIVAQPWSNGRVGGLGDSYEANTAALLSALEHPAVRAVVPRFFDFDPYRSPVLPGGLFEEDFTSSWTQLTVGLDRGDICAALDAQGAQCQALGIRGPLPVDEDTDRTLLQRAIAEHQSNTNTHGAASAITYRDDPFGAGGPTLEDVSLYARAAAIEAGGVPWLSWGSWYDSGTADAALNAFGNFSNPQQVIIGAWGHGGEDDADPYHDPDALSSLERDAQIEQGLDFLDDYLQRDAAPPERNIRYYTAREGTWATTSSWPPPGVVQQSWYLGAGARLESEPPTVAGSDRYAVDFTATTGPDNRWATQKRGDDVIYPDRRTAAGQLLTYTSDPLPSPLRVVGHPILRLQLSSSREDGALFVYLEDVAPDGRVTYLTEGLLRLLHRRAGASPYASFGPQHSFLRADGALLTPDQPELVELTLLPLAALIGAGHRLRVSIAGHDAGSFRRYPEQGAVELSIARSPEQPSWLELPYLP